MASEPPSVFKQSDRNLARLRKMCDAGSTKALLILLKWLNPKWMPPMSFKDYLDREKKVTMEDFNNAIDENQSALLMKDTQGDTYDISLLYILIQWGNGCLADKGNPVWYKKSECQSLEILITAVKNVRNELMHCYNSIDTKEFHQKTETLRQCIKDMLNCAGNKYELITQAEVDQTLHDLNILINKIRDDPLNPKDFADYRKQLIFPEQCDFVKTEGTKALQKRHSNYSILTPLCHLAKVSFPVNEVFTDMVLKGESKTKHNLELHYLLEKDGQCNVENIILLEGNAGVGKTTLVKKILSDWANERRSLKYLETYDLIIHAECREHIGSFKGILDSSMAEVSKNFQGSDLMFVVLSLKCIVIIDGFDELNKISANLFKEILEIKMSYDITVIVTSRPEAITKYYKSIQSYKIQTTHIQLLGIPPERREHFVRRYYTGMEKISQGHQDIAGLLNYLKRTEHRLTELWRLPYNLTILTILWTIQPDIINSITTAPELHWEMHQLYLSKLKERLLGNKATKHLPSSVTEKKVHQFIYSLCQVSLTALENDDVTLPNVAYQLLEDTCMEAEVPVEEMAGAFLKRTTSNSGTRYSYPHKGLQDFLAALFIWTKLTASPMDSKTEKIIRTIDKALNQNNVSIQVSQNIKALSKLELMKAESWNAVERVQNFDAEKVENDTESILSTNKVPEDLSLDITRIINERINKYFFEASQQSSSGAPTKEINIEKIIKAEIGQAGLSSVAKFQNMFTVLIGLFYQDNTGTVEDETKLEALELLRRTGVTDRKAWLQILNSVKCDEFVATYISKEAEILEGSTGITDSTIFAYISVMKAMKPPLPNAHKISITINIKGDISGVGELLNLISIHQLTLRTIWIYDDNFREYTEVFKDLELPLKDPNNVNIRVDVKEKLLGVIELMTQIKRNNFNLIKLNLLSHDLVIDQRFEDQVLILKSLPTVIPQIHHISIVLYIKEMIPAVMNEMLTEICRNKYKLDVHIAQGFLNPATTPNLEDSLNKVFEECKVGTYTGTVTKGMRLPAEANKLHVGIADANSYTVLLQYLNSVDMLVGLRVCMNHRLAATSHLMEPLPDMDIVLGPSLFITDIKLKTDVDNAVTLLKKLAPVGQKGFDEIVFPDASLTYELMEEFLIKLTGLKVVKSMEFPSSNKPSSPERECCLQKLAKEATNCERGIEWKGDDMKDWCDREIMPGLPAY